MVQAKKKRRREAGAVSMAWGRRSDRQVLFLLAQLDDLLLAQFVLTDLCLADEIVELIVVEILDIDGHGRTPVRVTNHAPLSRQCGHGECRPVRILHDRTNICKAPNSPTRVTV